MILLFLLLAGSHGEKAGWRSSRHAGARKYYDQELTREGLFHKLIFRAKGKWEGPGGAISRFKPPFRGMGCFSQVQCLVWG